MKIGSPSPLEHFRTFDDPAWLYRLEHIFSNPVFFSPSAPYFLFRSADTELVPLLC